MTDRALDAWLAERLFDRKLDPKKVNLEAHLNYSRSWEGAGLVVDAMRERGWRIHGMEDSGTPRTIQTPDGPEILQWYVRLWSQDRTQLVEVNASTAPLAIALAAKAALEKEDGDG